jgi:hypothetical protein
MESNKVDLFMISNAKYFESYHLSAVIEKLNSLDDEKWPLVLEMQFKNPDTMMIISLNTIVENIPHDPVIFGLMGSLDFLYDDN